jgi:APA family basic amino acid/polyamine antiporter
METLKKKYGLATATAMVVGIVIGSGVFFKAEKILSATGGNLSIGILSWIIGGIIMIVCAYNFAVMATKYEKVNGIVDYAEATVGPKYGYFIGWFMATTYYPTLTGVLAWVSARYTCVLLGQGWSIVGPECLAITMFYLVASYALNSLSPILAGKFQVSTTVIKLIPLFAMAIIGTISGLSSGLVVENFSVVVVEMDTMPALLTAVCATAFAYEGWIIATSINAEIKDAKVNLPKALVGGTFVIMITYILYYVGLSGAVENSVLMESGESGARIAFSNIFSNVMGTGLFVFVVISCLGTLNGLMMGCTRGFYALAARDMGPAPDTFKQLDAKTNMPTNASVLGLLFAGIWLLYFYGANLTAPWFGFFAFDSSELPIITIYGMYIPIFIMFILKEKNMGTFKGKLMPMLGVLGSLFMMYAAYVSHGRAILAYLILFLAIQMVGMFFMKRK